LEELFLGHKVKERGENNAEDRDIGPILVLGENDHRPIARKDPLAFDLNSVKNGKNDFRNLFSQGVDKRISVHIETVIIVVSV
jgi:hypothetical protein